MIFLQVVKKYVRRYTGRDFAPQNFVCDFEMSIISAVETELPTTQICLCYFHFTQSIWRAVQRAQLVADYRRSDTLKMYIRKFMSCAFLPLAVVRNNMNLLVNSGTWFNLVRRFPSCKDIYYFITLF